MEMTSLRSLIRSIGSRDFLLGIGDLELFQTFVKVDWVRLFRIPSLVSHGSNVPVVKKEAVRACARIPFLTLSGKRLGISNVPMRTISTSTVTVVSVPTSLRMMNWMSGVTVARVRVIAIVSVS